MRSCIKHLASQKRFDSVRQTMMAEWGWRVLAGFMVVEAEWKSLRASSGFGELSIDVTKSERYGDGEDGEGITLTGDGDEDENDERKGKNGL